MPQLQAPIQPTTPTKLSDSLPEGADLLPTVVRDCILNGTCVTPDGRTFTFGSSSVKLTEAIHLYRVVNHLRPLESAEVGLCQAVSTLAIVQAMEDYHAPGKHHVIDPFQSTVWHNCGLMNIKAAGLERRVSFYEKFVEEVAPTLPPIQFGFIDGSHIFDLTILDFLLLDKRLEVGGVLGFHDMWMPAIQKVLRFILTNRAYSAYREVDGIHAPSPMKRRIKSTIAPLFKIAARTPGLALLLNPTLIQPLWTLGIEGNMVFVQKKANDNREYKFYKDF